MGMHRWINGILPQGDVGLYCEPFAGMLGVLLNRRPASNELVNDINGHIYTFWRAMRDYPEEFERLCHVTPYCRRTYEEAHEGLHTGAYDGDIVRRAWAVCVVVQQSMAHSVDGKGWGVVYTARGGDSGGKFAEKVHRLHARIRDVQLENMCALSILERLIKVPCDNAVVYCDPPYQDTFTSGYDVAELDREKMSDLLQKQKAKVAISGYDDEWIIWIG